MDFKNIPIECHPAYTWLWNTTITKEGIDRQIDEMKKCGIKAFYVIGEPDDWRPGRRETHLYPKYLTDEYVELLLYAFEKAKEQGMYFWLYNEAAFPSGSAGGLVTEKYPELAYKYISVSRFVLEKGKKYQNHSRAIAAFVDDKRIFNGYIADTDVNVTEYYWDSHGDLVLSHRVDNADKRGSEEFIRITHERLKQSFGDYMGSEISYMFDDEAFMGGWTQDIEKFFIERYGYDMSDYIPYISKDKVPKTESQYRAVSDYMMLTGDLLRNNYFIPMREWLNKTNMLSVGHIDNDDKPDCAYIMRYGNAMQTLRAFDVPGVDVIWEQISYPTEDGCCPQSMESFPRLASSAARQIGRNVALSESFAVYGGHVTPDLMRFTVNYQAVRGINLFNFMVMSYDRETPMRHQYRPNFLIDNVGMDSLSQINDYTARLSYILSQGKADVKTALYYPYRTVCAGGEVGSAAANEVVTIGKMLENKGVSFDFIDEELVSKAKIVNGKLVSDFVEYENVFVATGKFELPEVMNKLSVLNSRITPDITRLTPDLQTRKIVFEDGSEGYFLYNQSGGNLYETVEITSDKIPYEVNLFDGEVYAVPYKRKGGNVAVELSLVRGEGAFIWFSDEQEDVKNKPKWNKYCEINEFKSSISRIYKLDYEHGVKNIHPSLNWHDGFVRWDDGLSGEVTYVCTIPSLEEGEYRLNLGEVRHFAKVYINGLKIGEATMYPYTVKLDGIRGGEELKIVVANTVANECARSDYFSKFPSAIIGPYHERMVTSEAKETVGGLFGPITIEAKK